MLLFLNEKTNILYYPALDKIVTHLYPVRQKFGLIIIIKGELFNAKQNNQL